MRAYAIGLDALGGEYISSARVASRSVVGDIVANVKAAKLDAVAIAQMLNNMTPMTVAQAHAAVRFGAATYNAIKTMKTAYGGSLSAEQAKALADFENFDRGVDLAGVDPLSEETANQIRVAVLRAVADYNGGVESVATVSAAPGQAAAAVRDAVSDLVQKGKDLAGSVAWYAKATYWIAIGAAVLALLGVAWGVSSGLRQRVARST